MKYYSIVWLVLEKKMIKELNYRGVKIFGITDDNIENYYYEDILPNIILKYFSIIQLDNSIIIQYEDIEHINKVDLEYYNGKLSAIVRYNQINFLKLSITDYELSTKLIDRWDIITDREPNCTTFKFN